MALEMPYDDLCRDLKHCVVMFKNKPVYVTSVGRDGLVYFLDLLTQKEGNAPFTLKAFDAPIRRIGFVNCMGSVVYVTRIPVRKFFMGLATGNTQVKALVHIAYENGAGHVKQRVGSLMTPELGQALMNSYPSLEEAVKAVKARPGAVAFDSMFCVDSQGKISYKGAVVGSCKGTAKKASDIVWNEGKEYLNLLLDNNHEKTVRDYRPKAD